MSGWKAKRFWRDTTVSPQGEGFTVLLDGRPARTPGRSLLTLPTQALAEAIAAEWNAQETDVIPATMPFTRMANSAIEKVGPLLTEVANMVADYGGTDLLCYRAPGPAELVRRQRAWDGLLDWASECYGARLTVTQGVMHVAQPEPALERLRAPVLSLNAFELAAFHDLVALTGSLILGLMLAENRLSADEAWALSRLDEDFQAEQWGHDAEAAEAAALKRQALGEARQFLALARLPIS